jgi:hypothetical protein
LISEIKSIAQIKSKEEDIEVLKTQYEAKEDFINNEDQRSLQENLQILEEGETLNTLNKDWVEHKRAAMLSPLGIGNTTQNAYYNEVLDKINEAQVSYEFYDDQKSAEEYFKTLQDAEISIEVGRKNGLLDAAAAKVLYSRIHTKRSKEAQLELGDSLDRAIKYFRKEIKDKDDQDAAIKEYTYRMSDKEKKDLNADKVLETIKGNYLKSKDPSYNAERFKNIANVRLITVGSTIINPLTMEQKILDKSGQWVTIE